MSDELEQQNMVEELGLQERLVWYAPKGGVYDLEGGDHLPLCTVAGMKGQLTRFDHVRYRGQEQVRTSPVTTWLRGNPRATMKPPILDPRLPVGFSSETGADYGFINTYKPYQPEGAGDPADAEHFVTLVRHVAPEDWEYALDWMAYKLQHPEARMVALVSYTPIFGTGRGSLFDIFGKVLGHHMPMDAASLFGSNAKQFNTHLANALLISVGEIDENSDYVARQTIYNKLKELVDPDKRVETIEPKGVDKYSADIFTSFMLATNLGGALPLEPGDRRFSVLSGSTVGLRVAHPEIMGWLADAREGQRLDAIFHFLKDREVSQFNASMPLENAAKDALTQDAKDPLDDAIEETVEDLNAGGIVTVAAVCEVLKQHGGPNYKLAMSYGTKLTYIVRSWVNNHTRQAPHCDGRGRMRVRGDRHQPRILLDRPQIGYRPSLTEVEEAVKHLLDNVERLKLRQKTRPFGVKAV
ncbi:primase-helicase family protein [uncultured Shimia sp.]|uniref:primase-helicase family protein n=1 Tax=uncultured Shimia sp. TaxID=573152 RepID=UPI0026139AEF|nr:primase-helicase family protein [uncultured Shimia sp.]